MDYAGKQQAEADVTLGQFVPEIAAAAAAAGRLGGVPLVPGPNNVVILPPGATLDDIAVQGRDLVITLDDGRVFVIADGAVDVPQIVVDGVTVPPLNLAALLIGNEPEPAAGPLRSSGGNFADPTGPIQDAFDLGDLLPYTELAFPEPREREIVPDRPDEEPTTIIITPDQPAGAVTATASVNEAGLPARGSESAGSNAASNSETTAGSIVFDTPDGFGSISLNGVAITAVGQTFVTPRGVLTITSINPGNYGYSYTLTDNTSGDATSDDFSVVVIDADGDTASATLAIRIIDDVPTARNDTDTVAGGTYGPESGNVLSGAGTTSGTAGADTFGADGAIISGVRVGNSGSFGAVGTTIAGQYGTLTLGANGTYTYVRNTNTPGGVSDVFSYQLTDGDGDTSTATLTINIGDAPNRITFVPGIGEGTTVPESHLPPRNGEPAGSQFDGDANSTGSTITFTSPDGVSNVTIGGVTLTPGSLPQTIISDATGTLVITGYSYNPATGLGSITYVYTLKDNTLAPDGSTVPFTIVVTDLDGDAASDTLTIRIIDDVPTARDDSGTQTAENAPVTVNVFANDTAGADGVNLTSGVALVPGSLTGAGTLVYNANGTFTYTPAPGEEGVVTFRYTITDGDGDPSTATVTITLLDDSRPAVEVGGERVVAEAGLPARGDEPQGSGEEAAAGANGDTSETTTGTIATFTGGDAIGSLIINGVNVTSGGTVTGASGTLTVTVAAGVYSYSYTLTDNTVGNGTTDSFSVVLTDSDGDAASDTLVIDIVNDRPTAVNDTDTILGGSTAPATGNVITDAEGDGGKDTVGADDAAVTAISGVAAGTVNGTTNGSYGVLTLNADGSYSYVRNSGTPGNVEDVFTYTITDGDGQTSTATLTIVIEDERPVTGENATALLDDDALVGGNSGGDGDDPDAANLTGTLAGSGGDGALTWAYQLTGAPAGFSYVANGTGIDVFQGDVKVLVVTLGASDGTYTVSQVAPIRHAAGETENNQLFTINYSVTDVDGDFAPGSFQISVDDDTPLADDDGQLASVDDNAAGVVIGTVAGLLSNDDYGADGAGSPAITIAVGSLGGTIAIVGGNLVYTSATNITSPYAAQTETFTYTITDGDGDTDTATFTVVLTDTGPSLTPAAAAIAVDEDGLSGGLADGPGDLAGAGITQSGTLAGLSFGADGPGNIVLAAVADTGLRTLAGGVIRTEWDNASHTLTGYAPDNTPMFTLVITDVLTGAYTFTLLQPVKHLTAGTEDDATFAIGVTVTDAEGESAAGSISVLIDDDTPLADDDGQLASVDDNAAGVVIGTVAGLLSNDDYGADGAGSPAITIAVGSLGGTIAIVGGNLVYTSATNITSPYAAQTETFTYTITDGDGDTDTATFTVVLTDTGPSLTPAAAAIAVDEDGLSGGLADGPGDLAGAGITQSGTLAGLSFGADGPGNIVLAAVADTGLRTLAGGVIRTEWDNASHTLTGYAPDNTPMFTLVITDVLTGAYTFTLLQPVKHLTAGTEDDATFAIGVTVTDAEGESAAGSISVLIDDDTPLADDDGQLASVDDNAAGVVIGTVAGLLSNDDYGADGAGSPAITIAVGSLGGTIAIVGGNLVYTSATNITSPYAAQTETFTYTITDGDGDTDTATFTVVLTDTGPSLTPAAAAIAVDEDGLSGGLADGPGDLAGAGITQSGTLAGLSFGADGPGNIVLAAVADTGLRTLAGGVIRTEWDNASHTLTGYAPDNTPMFTLVITDVLTGAYTFTLLQPVKHLTAGTEDDATFAIGVTVTDAEGESAAGSISVLIDDDTPLADDDGQLASVDDNAAGVVIGTVAGLLSNDDYGADGAGSPAITIAVGSLGGTIAIVGGNLVYTSATNITSPYAAQTETFTYTITDGDGDTDTATFTVVLTDTGPSLTPAAAAIAVDEDGLSGGLADGPGDLAGAGITQSGTLAGLSFGADGPGNIVLAAVADTGLRTLAGGVIRTEWDNASHTLTGYAPDNTPMFTLVITDVLTGAYTFTLLQPVKHLTAGTEDDATFAIGVTVTDAEGESAAGSISVLIDDDTPLADDDGQLASVDDNAAGVVIGTVAGLLSNDDYGADGAGSPAITIAVGSLGGTIAIVGGNLVYTSATNITSPYAAQTETFTYTITDGDGDTDTATFTVVLTDTGPSLTPAAAAIAVDEDGLSGGLADGPGDLAGAGITQSGTLAGLSFGADGPGNIVLAAVADTGLRTLAGGVIRTEWDNASHTLTGYAPDNTPMFTLVITDVLTGAYTFTLLQPVKHLTAGTEDDATFAIGVTVTDAEGESAAGSISVLIDDDTPVNFTPVALTDTANSTVIAQDNALENNGSANVTRLINDANNDGIGENFIGADGFGSLFFNGGSNGSVLLNAAGAAVTSGGSTIYLFGFGTGTLIATTSSTNTNPGAVVFQVTLATGAGSGANSTYTIQFFDTLDDGSGFVFDDFSSAPAGQNEWIGLDADGNDINADNNNSEDLLITGIGGTVNTSATDLGTGNQWTDAGEGIRLDFVYDVARNGANDEKDVQGYTFDGHYGVTNASFSVLQLQGGGTASVRVRLLNDADTGTIQTLTGSTVNIDLASIVVKDSVGNIITGTVTIHNMGDGTVVITGIDAGDNVYVEAVGDVQFNAMEVTNASNLLNTFTPAPNDTFGGTSFSTGIFGFTSAVSGSDIDLSFGVGAVDGDGDTSSGTINVTLVPPSAPPVVLDLDGDGVEFLSQAAGVAYDYDGDGIASATAWAGGDDGILALDANGDGTVSNAAEFVFGGNGLTDLEALAANHDSNHDGLLTSADVNYASFGVWQDANSNGLAEAGEFKSLAELGIASIGLTSDGASYVTAAGDVVVHGTAAFTKTDGSTGAVADASFAVAANDRQAARNFELAQGSIAASGMVAALTLAAANQPAASDPATASPAAVHAATADNAAAAGNIGTGGDKVEAVSLESVDPVAAAAASGGHQAAPDLVAAKLAGGDQGLSDRPDTKVAQTDEDSGKDAGSLFDFASGSTPAMDALLTLGTAGAASQQTTAELPDVAEAFADAAGSAVVDSLVDYFAADSMGAPAASPNGGAQSLHALLNTPVGDGGHATGGMFDVTHAFAELELSHQS